VAGGGMAEAEGLHDSREVEGNSWRQEAAAAVASAVAGVPGAGTAGGHTVCKVGAAAGRGDGGGERGGKRVRVGLSPPQPWRWQKHRHRRPCRTLRPCGSPAPCSFCRRTCGGLDGIGCLGDAMDHHNMEGADALALGVSATACPTVALGPCQRTASPWPQRIWTARMMMTGSTRSSCAWMSARWGGGTTASACWMPLVRVMR
jgi:hypothetical protein